MKRRLSAAMVAMTLAGAALVASAQLASANTGSGSCQTGSLGKVCINPGPTGYDAEYWNTTSHATYVDFNLIYGLGTHVGDKGGFTARPGTKHTYYFATGDKGCAQVGLYDLTGQLPPTFSGYSC